MTTMGGVAAFKKATRYGECEWGTQNVRPDPDLSGVARANFYLPVGTPDSEGRANHHRPPARDPASLVCLPYPNHRALRDDQRQVME
jgi:hypothetical protein